MSVSVVMPARNAVSHIREAIASVLAQGLDVDALIIVDDGSSDATGAIVRTFADGRIRLAANDGRGVSAARNAGARAAPGEWLMFLDADDRLRIPPVRRGLPRPAPRQRPTASAHRCAQRNRAGRTAAP
jgi:glycosyltransferase involved in cell wall biosynthesis